MSSVFAALGVAILKRLITETFLSKVAIEILWALAKSSKNTLDDKIVRHVAEALNVKIEDNP
jgi:hypothetical protein